MRFTNTRRPVAIAVASAMLRPLPSSYHTLDRDVIAAVMSSLDSPQDLANYAQTNRNHSEASQQTQLKRIVRELKSLLVQTPGSVGRRKIVYNADCPEQVLPPGCKYELPAVRPETLCCLAAAFGRLDWLLFLRGRGFRERNVLSMAAGAGHLEIMKWAWEEPDRDSPAWVNDELYCICAYAMAGGHLPVLKWGGERGYPWPPHNGLAEIDYDLYKHNIGIDPGEYEIYKRSNRNLDCFGRRCGLLDGANHVEILKWLFYHDGPEEYVEERRVTANFLPELAYYRRNIGVAKWLAATGFTDEQY